jgi:hypothetical protein
MTVGQDYLAGTDPNNANSILRITAENFASGGTSAVICSIRINIAGRQYLIQEAAIEFQRRAAAGEFALDSFGPAGAVCHTVGWRHCACYRSCRVVWNVHRKTKKETWMKAYYPRTQNFCLSVGNHPSFRRELNKRNRKQPAFDAEE